MNSNQKTLAACGGAIAVAALAAGFFAWSAYDSKVAALEGDDEGNDGLLAVEDMAQTLSRKPVYPCAASVKAIEANTAKVSEWTLAARRIASRGDRPVRKMTEAQFKTELVADAKRLAELPGALPGGGLMKPDFDFGPFKPYITEGKMPETERLPELVRRWDDVQLVVETLASAGIFEITEIGFGADAAAAKAAEPAKGAARRPGSRRPAAGAKAKAKGRDAKAADAEGPKSFSYVFTFSARPPAFVRAINTLCNCERFVIVDSVAIARTEDAISDALGGTEKKEAARPSGRRGSRRPAAAAEQKSEKQDEAKAGVVTDPQSDAPLKITLALTVCDFGLLADDDEDEKKKEDAK